MLLSRLGFALSAKVSAGRVSQSFISTSIGRRIEENSEHESYTGIFASSASKQISDQLDNQVQSAEIKHKSKKNLISRANSCLNRVELVGGVAENPTFHTAKNEKKLGFFRLITNINFQRSDGKVGEQKEIHEIIVFGSLVDYVQKNVSRGNRLFVSGRLTYVEQAAPSSRNARVIADTLLASVANSEKKST